MSKPVTPDPDKVERKLWTAVYMAHYKPKAKNAGMLAGIHAQAAVQQYRAAFNQSKKATS